MESLSLSLSSFFVRLCLSLAASSTLAASGCATHMGSRSLPEVRINYTEAIARSAEEQMLFNIVRLRHLHAPVFLQVSSVVTQYAVSSNVGASGAYNAVAPGGFAPQGTAGLSTGVAVEERPTVTYTPLHGEDFVRRLATPLSHEAIAQLVQAGWPWDAVLSCCVQQINGRFAPANPWKEEHSDFQRLGRMMRSLQEMHALSVRMTPRGTLELVFAVPGTDEGRKEAEEVRRLLGLDPDVHRCAFTETEGERPSNTVTVHGRSMMATLYYVSQGVEGPSLGRPVLGEDALLHVRRVKKSKAPSDAYAAVEYDGEVFYIDRADTDSQGIFVLLTYLFSVMSTPGGGGPVVTVGAGG